MCDKPVIFFLGAACLAAFVWLGAAAAFALVSLCRRGHSAGERVLDAAPGASLLAGLAALAGPAAVWLWRCVL